MLGDRNGKLDALKGRQWDVCIDIPTTLPVWVRDAARILQGNVDRYDFISTISVYSDTSKPGMDESGPLAKYEGADAMKETQQTLLASNFALYGPLKVQSELEAEKCFPGKSLIIRPGLIAGPGDESDRFTYWPVRLERGGEILAPGDGSDPVQLIDARDLAEWTIRMAEQRARGVFNAVGPKTKLTMREMLSGVASAVKAPVNAAPHFTESKFTWADTDFLAAQERLPWGDMPVWVRRATTQKASLKSISSKALCQGTDLPDNSRRRKPPFNGFTNSPPRDRQSSAPG